MEQFGHEVMLIGLLQAEDAHNWPNMRANSSPWEPYARVQTRRSRTGRDAAVSPSVVSAVSGARAGRLAGWDRP